MKDLTRYTVSQSTLDTVISAVMRDTEPHASESGQEGARARCIRALYPPLMRWIVEEMDLQTKPSNVAIGFADSAGILTATVLYNTAEPEKYEESGNLVMQRQGQVAEMLLKDSDFESVKMDQAGES